MIGKRNKLLLALPLAPHLPGLASALTLRASSDYPRAPD